MSVRTRRTHSVSEYKQNRRSAGAYRIVNQVAGKTVIGSTTNLDSIQANTRFAKITQSGSALDMRLRQDVMNDSIDVFVVEIIEELDITQEMTDAQILDELKRLAALYREQADLETLC